MDVPIIFSSSLPRSGSTLVQNLLAQNPKYHCTATNDLIEMLIKVRDSWMSSPCFVSQGLENVRPRIKNMLKGMMEGFYKEEFAKGKIVFDKSRGWPVCIELMEEILGRPIKLICCVRDMRDIIASFEKLYRRSTLTDHPLNGPDTLKCLTVQGRANRILSVEHSLGYMAHALHDVFQRGLSNRLVIVPYHDLTHHPIETIRRVCRECSIPEFDCNPHYVQKLIYENDTVYGMYDLHDIKSKVEPSLEYGWKGILPQELADVLHRDYYAIQELAARRYFEKSATTEIASLKTTFSK